MNVEAKAKVSGWKKMCFFLVGVHNIFLRESERSGLRKNKNTNFYKGKNR